MQTPERLHSRICLFHCVWGHFSEEVRFIRLIIGRSYTKEALSVWTNLGKHFVVRLGYASLV